MQQPRQTIPSTLKSNPSYKYNENSAKGTLTYDDEEPVQNNLDGFKVQNLRKPAALNAVTHQDEDDEFDEIPFMIKHKPKLPTQTTQLVQRKEPETQLRELVSA